MSGYDKGDNGNQGCHKQLPRPQLVLKEKTDKRKDGADDAPSGTYFEIARGLNFWQDTKFAPLSLHVEYNGGVYKGYSINNAWLFGVNYFMHSSDFKNTLTLQVLYKTIAHGKSDLPMQLTAVWGMNDLFGVQGLAFSGFELSVYRSIQAFCSHFGIALLLS